MYRKSRGGGRQPPVKPSLGLIFMPTNVLVTGGAGYIGAVLVPMLLRDGFAVHVLDNFRFDQTSLTDCCLDPNFRVTRGDCREQATLAAALRDADIILPLAAIVGAGRATSTPLPRSARTSTRSSSSSRSAHCNNA